MVNLKNPISLTNLMRMTVTSVRSGARHVGSPIRVATFVAAVAVITGGVAPAPVIAQTVSTPAAPWITLPDELFEAPALGLESESREDGRSPGVAPSFSELFGSIGNDFKSFPTGRNIMWLAIGGGLSGLSHEADDELTASLSTSGAVNTLKPGKYIGGTLAQMGAAFATYGIGRLTGSDTVAVVGADLVRAQVLTQGITQGIKFIGGRTRPDGTGRSFPSGHTASAFATSTVLQRHFGWKVGIPAYGLATYVAASRLSENRHYLSDVIFGATLGILAARQVTVDLGKTKFAVEPMVVPGGGGVSLVRIGR